MGWRPVLGAPAGGGRVPAGRRARFPASGHGVQSEGDGVSSSQAQPLCGCYALAAVETAAGAAVIVSVSVDVAVQLRERPWHVCRSCGLRHFRYAGSDLPAAVGS